MEDTTGARSVNADSLLGLVLSVGGCWVPPDDSGAFSVNVWSRLLGDKDAETIRRWIRNKAIPVLTAGNQQLIEARDMRRYLAQDPDSPVQPVADKGDTEPESDGKARKSKRKA